MLSLFLSSLHSQKLADFVYYTRCFFARNRSVFGLADRVEKWAVSLKTPNRNICSGINFHIFSTVKSIVRVAFSIMFHGHCAHTQIRATGNSAPLHILYLSKLYVDMYEVQLRASVDPARDAYFNPEEHVMP